MKARDVMTDAVVSVSPDATASQVSRLLLDNGISAVPVVDSDGAPLGMVSEGDLIGRSEAAREARRDWWLELLAEGETLNAEFMASLRTPERTVRDLMSAPVVTVGEETEVGEIARLLAANRIKRVPVVRDGRIIGIVSRADLLRTLAGPQPSSAAPGGARPG
jgi:CBS domain-containing protein